MKNNLVFDKIRQIYSLINQPLTLGAILLFTLTMFVGCENSRVSSVGNSDGKPIDKAKLDSVIKKLQAEPNWLFSGNECPAEIAPANKIGVRYLSEGCSQSPEGCLKQCELKDGNACYALALLLQNENQNGDKATDALFLQACRHGIVSGCTNNAAAKVALEKSNASAQECAARTFEKTCRLNDAWGCAMYGLALMNGEGVAKDTDKALQILPQACQHGDDSEPCQRAREMKAAIEKSRSATAETTSEITTEK